MTVEEYIAKFPKQKRTNDNCLIDIACPECGQRSEFSVRVTTLANITDDGTDANCGDHEFEDDTPTECARCHHEGKLADFTIEGLDDAIASPQQKT